ncbi:glycosyltransferase family 2 protein [Candidatus Sumerlaeota bacterium]|nr:glycosyltransferase family 2 protein [Candidatus Sumerlaeota bacterium]
MSPYPSVSVVTPTYNDVRFLAESVESVLAQDYPGEIEIVVVDDGSDPPAESLYRPADPRVRILRKPNGGSASARNHGVDHSQGDYISFVDADDAMLPGRLSNQIGLLETHPEAGLAASDITRRETDGTEKSWGLFESFRSPVPCDDLGDDKFLLKDEFKNLILLDYPFNGSVTYRRSMARAGLRFDESLRCYEEWDFIVRAARMARVAYHRRPGTLYRRHAGSITARPDPGKFAGRAAMFRRWRTELADLEESSRLGLIRAEFESLVTASYEYRQSRRASALACAWTALRLKPGPRALKCLAGTILAGGAPRE